MLHTHDIFGVVLAGILIFCIMLLLGFIVRASIHRRRARKKLDQIRTGTTYSTLAEAGLNLFGGLAGVTRDNMFLPNITPDRQYRPGKPQSLEEMLLNYH